MSGHIFPSVLYFKHNAESKANIKLNTNRKKSTGHTLAEETGKISYNMTNDYMFRTVLQKSEKVLKGLIGALLHVDPESLDVEIMNPITLGQSFENKDFILDISVSIKDKAKLNLEMQMVNYGNWKERSLSYLCRSFDNVYKGQDYITVEPVIQISFLDFPLFPESPEFYATYMMKNIKTDVVYTDKLRLSVVELNSISLAAEEDCLYQIDKWAKFFKVKTWEELKAMATTNQYMEAAANTIFEVSSDENIRELCRRRAEFEAFERHQNAEIAQLKKLNTTLTQANADKDAEIARLKQLIASLQSK